MTARTHDLIAFGSLVTVAALYPPNSLTVPTLITCIVGNVVGALIPDMDQASNRLWDLLPGGNALGKIFRHLFLGHRTISHSLLGGYLLYQGLLFAIPKVFNSQFVDQKMLIYSVMIGFVSHLIADAATKEGIPLFFPFSIKIGIPPIKFLRVTTGSWVENWVVLPLVILYIGFVVQKFNTTFVSMLQKISA